MNSDMGARRGGSGDLTDSFFTTPFSSDPWDHPSDYAAAVATTLRGRDCNEEEEDEEGVAALAHANVDWRETQGAHIFSVDLPGVRKEDVKVQLEDDNLLHISGQRIVEKVDENDKWHRVERRRGSFSRRFRLPENADAEGIKCGLEHGVLTVELPKKQLDQHQQPTNVRYIHVA